MNFTREKKNNLKRLIKYGRFFFCGFLVPFRSVIYDTSKHKYRSCAFHIAKQQQKLSWDFTFSLFRCYFCVFKIVSISFLMGKRQLHRDRSEKKTHIHLSLNHIGRHPMPIFVLQTERNTNWARICAFCDGKRNHIGLNNNDRFEWLMVLSTALY